MKINHHVSFNVDEEQKARLAEIGIDVQKYAWRMFAWSSKEDVTFDIAEDDERWEAVNALFRTWGGTHVPSTKFTAAELNSASYLNINSTWYCISDDEYLDNFEDRSSACNRCGIGRKQIHPYRMRMEPKWGTRHVMQYYGHADELFVRPEVWHDVFKPFGIGCLPVFKKNTDQELKTVVQLKVDKVSDSYLQTEKLDYEVCSECNQMIFDLVRRGPLPNFQHDPRCHMFKTRERFCPSARVFQEIIISQDLYQAIKKSKIKSLRYIPVSDDVLDNCSGRVVR